MSLALLFLSLFSLASLLLVPGMQCGIDLVALRPSLLGAWASSSFPPLLLEGVLLNLSAPLLADDLGRVGVVSHQACATLDGRPSTDVVHVPPPLRGVSFVLSLPEEGRRQPLTAHPTQHWCTRVSGVRSMPGGEGEQGDGGVWTAAWVSPV